MTRLDGQAALITGGGSGIGLACARALLDDGATVTIAGRSKDRLKSAAESLGSDRVHYVACDVASEEAVVAAVDAGARPLGGLHMAVAAAGTSTFGAFVDTALTEWQQVMD